MRGIPFISGTALLALGLLGPAAIAGDEPDLQKEVAKLRQEVHTLKTSMLENEIDTYLEDQSAWAGAQGGGGLQGVTINARFTAVSQNTIGLDVAGPADVSADHSLVSGNVDLDFDFQVTDNLRLFIYLTASETADANIAGGPNLPVPSGGSLPLGFSLHRTALLGSGMTTLAGADDGIGVNGTTPTDPGSITVYEAGIQHAFNVGDNKLHWEMGSLDPRNRFLQSSISDNADTNFIHNAFDDPSAVPWRTGAIAGAFNSTPPGGNGPRIQGVSTIVGWHMWISFGDNKQYTVNWGWFNGAGQYWDRGTFMFQFHWKGEVSGREMNVRLMGFLDESLRDASMDGSAGGGAVWDWMLNDKIGIFFKIATNGGDTQVVELDASIGVVFHGLIGSRPDDTLGIGVSFANANDGVLNNQTGPGGATWQEDTELTVEIYYAYMMEDGKLQITPHLIFVSDPGGGDGTGTGASLFSDDQLFILGVRIHVPF